MGKWVTVSIKDKELAKKPEAKRWVKKCEKLIEEAIREKLFEFMTTGSTTWAEEEKDGEA